MDVSPRAKLDEEKRPHDVLLVSASRKARCATKVALFKVRFCLLAQHEEAVLEDEEAKHIERMMMMRCVTTALRMEKRSRHFPKEERNE